MQGEVNQFISKDHPDNYTNKDLNIGDIVYSFSGCTYGCISSDGIAISFEKDQNPFYEVRENWITWKN
jgi:hypothetical protein